MPARWFQDREAVGARVTLRGGVNQCQPGKCRRRLQWQLVAGSPRASCQMDDPSMSNSWVICGEARDAPLPSHLVGAQFLELLPSEALTALMSHDHHRGEDLRLSRPRESRLSVDCVGAGIGLLKLYFDHLRWNGPEEDGGLLFCSRTGIGE